MWYYSTDGKQTGPIDDATLDNLSATGVVTPETYVWKDGMPDWAPLSQVRPVWAVGVVPVPAMGTAEVCSICGKAVGADNLIDLIGNRVCADCKPMAVQSLKEGAGIQSKTHTAWRDGKRVVAFDKTALPARCFKCNCNVESPPFRRKLYWHSPLTYLFLFFNILVYIIIAVIVRKRAVLDVYLCEQHVRRRRNFIIGSWLGVALSIGLFITAIALNIGWIGVVGFVTLVVAIVTGIVRGQLVRTVRIKKDGTVWLNGAGKEFLAGLPEWTGPAR